MVAQRTFNPWVLGSSPRRRTAWPADTRQPRDLDDFLVAVLVAVGLAAGPQSALPIRSAASVMTGGMTWAYLDAMLIWEWPRICMTTHWSTPWASRSEAAVCVASCTRASRLPAAWSRAFQHERFGEILTLFNSGSKK